jgi:tetratricopeptide (TPR) repeat protein
MLSEVLFGLGREQEALPPLQEAAQLFAQLEDHEAEAVMRERVAVVMERCAHPDAIAAWERVRALSQAAGDAHAELAALEGIARSARRAAQPPDAVIRCFHDALALASTLGDQRREAALRNTLGILHWERGAYPEALTNYEAALGLVRALGDRAHEGLTLNSIGVTLSRMRRYEEARTVLEEALAVNRQAGERLLQGHTLSALGDVAHALGRFDSAVRSFEESLSIRREIDDRLGEGWMLHRLARTRALMGDAAGAGACLERAARIAAECGDMALRRACGPEATASDAVRTQQE